MKRAIIISIVVVILVVVMNIITQKYTKSSVEQTSDLLYELRENLIAQNEEKIDNINKEVMEKWEEYKEKLVIYIEHAELEKAEMHLIETNSYIETKDYSMAIQGVDSSISSLEHIKERYEFSLKNIF